MLAWLSSESSLAFSNLSRADFRNGAASLSSSLSFSASSSTTSSLEDSESSAAICNSAMLFDAVSATEAACVLKKTINSQPKIPYPPINYS